MKTFKNYFLFLFTVLVFTSCSNEDAEGEVSLLGEWELTEWRIGIAADINNDGVSSFNLLDEIDCGNTETISFEAENVVSSIIERNPKLYLTERENAQGDYVFHLTCNEGTIGTASSYVYEDNSVEAFDETYIKDGNQLTKTTEYAIEIYNEDLTEAVGLLTSIKVYTKM